MLKLSVFPIVFPKGCNTGSDIHHSHTVIFFSSLKGIHPHDAKSWEDEGDSPTLQTLREFAMNPECVAIGECGLDFNRNFSPPETQLQVFEKQVRRSYLVIKIFFDCLVNDY